MRRFPLLLALLAILIAATGCSAKSGAGTSGSAPAASPAAQARASTPATAQESVTVGYVPVLIAAPLYIAIDRGYFQQEGLQINLQPVTGGTDIVAQTAAGNFNVSMGSIGPAYFNLVARARSLNQALTIEMVAPLHTERPPLATPLVVSEKAYRSGEITSVAQLKGKKVAVNAFGATEWWLERALETGGLTERDVDVVALPFQNVAEALDSGAIAGAMLGEPFATLALRAGKVHILTNDFLSGEQPTAVYYNTAWAKAHPRAAEGFMVAFLRAARDLEAGTIWNDPAALATLQKYTTVPADVIAAAARPHFFPDGKFNLTSLQNQERFFRQIGRLTYDQPLDFSTLINPTYAEQAAKQLGIAASGER